MLVTSWEIKEQADTAEVSAEVDGFRLWYRLPRPFPVSRAGDSFLAAALLPAMLQGETLEIDPRLPVSPKLLQNAFLLQEIHHCWNPELKLISIRATTSPAEPRNAGAMCFFSGGVDSTYTFLKRMEQISHVAFIQGFDFYANNKEASTFSVGDLSDLAQLSYKLVFPGDAVSAMLKSRLSATTLQSLSNYLRTGFAPGSLDVALAKDLEKIIAGRSIYEPQRFASIKLRPETSQLLTQDLQGTGLISLNRLLLEDAYPLEIARKRSWIYQTAIERNNRFVQRFQKILIPIETNHFPFGYRYNLSRNLTQGSALASVALLLGFSRVYLPAAYSYSQLIPLGSHPLTDPLWSNESVEIIHEGADVRRVNKIEKIVECESALENLRVCFNDMNTNCGMCAKCLRTMIPLKLLHASRVPFPPLPPLGAIRKMRIRSDIETIFFKENFDIAPRGGDEDLRGALRACMRRYEGIKLFKDFDRIILGGLMKRLCRGRTRDYPGARRIDVGPLGS